MIYYLENDTAKVGIKSAGAELCSFRYLPTNLEYIWQAEPSIWPRHAPILFPIVGKLPNGEYSYQGHTYKLPQHGFARDQDFRLLDQTQQELIFELTDSEETRRLYPFRFRLQVQYRLQENVLTTTYTVQNPANEEMYFSLGAHPAFNCPLLPHESFADYFLAFEQPETQARYLLAQGLLNGETEPLLQNETKLPLSYDLFLQDALVFKDLISEKIALKNLKHNHGLSFEFKGYPYFGIWTKQPGAGFICLEPWHGIASSVGDKGELTQKEGIIKLAAHATFNCAYTIRVH